MSRKRDNDLKERLKALRVSEPLKLNREGVVLKAPQERKEVPQIEAPPFPPSQSEIPALELPQNKSSTEASSAAPAKASHPTTAQIEGARFEVARNEIAQSEIPSPERTRNEAPQNRWAQANETQNELPQNELTQTDSAGTEAPQKAAPSYEAPGEHIEVPSSGAPQIERGIPQGFFKLSHSAFGEPLLRELSGDCFRLFLWLSSRAWRYPTSGGVVRASVSYIEIHAGMSHATISRGLKTLKEKGLVSVIEVDFKLGNLWRVSSLACGHPSPDDKPPRDRGPQNEGPRKAKTVPSKCENQSLKMRSHLPHSEQDLRSLKKIKNIKEGNEEKLHILVSIPPTETDSTTSAAEAEQILASFENQLSEAEQLALISAFVEREFPNEFHPPMKVVKMLTAKSWFVETWNTPAQPARSLG